MNPRKTLHHSAQNKLQSIIYVAAMAGLAGLVGWSVAGEMGLIVALMTGFMMLVMSPRLSSRRMIRTFGGRELTYAEAPQLFSTLNHISYRAGLERMPVLFIIPSPSLNALAVGNDHQDMAIGVTRGLLNRLTFRELVGVLAHEISHIAHRDTRMMALAGAVSQITGSFATVGRLLILLSLPIYFFGGYPIPWLALCLLLAAPPVSQLLHLALSRTREFHADLEAARLTGDPMGLASALTCLEEHSQSLLERLFMPQRRADISDWLRTHPATEARIERLKALAQKPRFRPNPEPPHIPQHWAA